MSLLTGGTQRRLSAPSLQKAGIIEYRRGAVSILKRDVLEESACECYATIKTEMARILNPYTLN